MWAQIKKVVRLTQAEYSPACQCPSVLAKQPPQYSWASLGHPCCSPPVLDCNTVCSPVAVGVLCCPRCHWSRISSSVCKNSRFHHLAEYPVWIRLRLNQLISALKKQTLLSLSRQMTRWIPSYQICCPPNCGEKHQFSFNCVSNPSVSENTNSCIIHI